MSVEALVKELVAGQKAFADELKGVREEVATVTKAANTLQDGHASLAQRLTEPATPVDPKVAGRRGFANPREFITMVMKAHLGDGIDKRLYPLAVDKNGMVLKAVGSDEARVISDPAGGFLVPP